MSAITSTAYKIYGTGDHFSARLEQISLAEPEDGQVIVETYYSSVNYKDALAGTGKGKILRNYPLTGGIDLAGIVTVSNSADFKQGDSVIITGCALSETKNGGYATYQLVESDDLVLLPENMSLKQSMIIGTAGFTAALCLLRMEQMGVKPEDGPVLVTGATGGVGSIACNLLSNQGYQVSALSRKTEQFDWLKELGADQCIDANSYHWGYRPLEKAHWAGVIDNVGGEVLSHLLREVKPWGALALCGMAAGHNFQSSVMPFIIRGISILGINSSACPMPIRKQIWSKLAKDWKLDKLDKIHRHSCELDTLSESFKRLLTGNATGRTVVNIKSG
ncbi:MAG: YhdH/YhfP family quinone oxidoreductase [bacterium]